MPASKPLSETAARRAERRASVPRVSLDMDETAASIGISTPGVYGLVEQGKLETFVVGRRRLARIEAIARCVQTLEKEAPPIPSRTGANNRSPADGSAA